MSVEGGAIRGRWGELLHMRPPCTAQRLSCLLRSPAKPSLPENCHPVHLGLPGMLFPEGSPPLTALSAVHSKGTASRSNGGISEAFWVISVTDVPALVQGIGVTDVCGPWGCLPNTSHCPAGRVHTDAALVRAP